MATQMAGQVAGEAIKVIADYVKSLKEPPEEVVRAFGRLEKFIDDYNARIQALGPIELPWEPPPIAPPPPPPPPPPKSGSKLQG